MPTIQTVTARLDRLEKRAAKKRGYPPPLMPSVAELRTVMAYLIEAGAWETLARLGVPMPEPEPMPGPEGEARASA